MSGWRLPSPAWKTLAICTRWRAAITASSRMISGSLELGAGAVQLDEEHRARVLRIAGARALIDRADHQLVEHLERRRDDAGGDDRRDRLGRLLDGPERGEDGLHRLGHVEEPHRDRRHEAERPLGADGQAREVVAGAVGDLAAEPHDL